jgi:hypothetical protein
MNTEIATTPAPEVQPLTLEDVQAYAPLTMEQLEAQLHDKEVLLQNINQLIKERNDTLGESLMMLFYFQDIAQAMGLEELQGKSKAALIPFAMAKFPVLFDLIENSPKLIAAFKMLKTKYEPVLAERQKQLELEKALGK